MTTINNQGAQHNILKGFITPEVYVCFLDEKNPAAGEPFLKRFFKYDVRD